MKEKRYPIKYLSFETKLFKFPNKNLPIYFIYSVISISFIPLPVNQNRSCKIIADQNLMYVIRRINIFCIKHLTIDGMCIISIYNATYGLDIGETSSQVGVSERIVRTAQQNGLVVHNLQLTRFIIFTPQVYCSLIWPATCTFTFLETIKSQPFSVK